MAKFTKIPETTFQQLQINAGLILKDFTPASGTFEKEDQLGATTGGITFTAKPTYSDFGSDVDNCPENTMEMKRIDDVEVKATGTFITVNTALAKSLMAAADVGLEDTTKVTPRRDLAEADFEDIWIVGDYSDKMESQYTAKTIGFETLAEGGHGVGDTISIDHEDIGGIYEETAWSVTLGAGKLMKHTAKRTVIA